MTRPIISGINVETGETIERELNDDEYAEYLIQVEKTIGLYPDVVDEPATEEEPVDELVEGEQP